jgi:subtilase family serine protease
MNKWSLQILVLGSFLLLTAPLVGASKPDSKADGVDSLVRLPGHVLPALAQAKAVLSQSKVAADEPLTLTLVLKRDDQAGFERYLREVYDPKSLVYRKFLTQSELSDRFGPSREAYEGVLSYLQDHGFTLVEGSANRQTLTVRGTRTKAERAFEVRIGDYELAERRFFTNDRDPALPSQLAARIQAIAGLSSLALPLRVDHIRSRMWRSGAEYSSLCLPSSDCSPMRRGYSGPLYLWSASLRA